MHLKEALANRHFLLSSLVGLVILGIGLVCIEYSTAYANASAGTSNYVNDIILSNTRVYDVGWLFVYGALAAIFFSIIVLFTIRLHFLPFAFKITGVFLMVRSIFVSLTHISPYPEHVMITQPVVASYSVLQTMFASSDLFFSVHTGLPFLMALVFWDTPWLRNVYIAISLLLAVVVLLGHLHYSIDVFAAYFITYGIFGVGTTLFRKDFEHARTMYGKA